MDDIRLFGKNESIMMIVSLFGDAKILCAAVHFGGFNRVEIYPGESVEGVHL